MAKRRKALLGDCRYYLHLLNNIMRNLSHNPEWFFKTSLPFSHPHVSHPACVPEHLSLMTSLANMSPRSSFNSAVRHLSLFKSPSPFPWSPSAPGHFLHILPILFHQNAWTKKPDLFLSVETGRSKVHHGKMNRWEWEVGSGHQTEADVTFQSRGGLRKELMKE